MPVPFGQPGASVPQRAFVPDAMFQAGLAALLNWVPEEVFVERAICPGEVVEMLFQVWSQHVRK